MVFLDANVFLRHLGAPATPIDAERGALARALFAEIRAGHRTATTSEVVLHEVCFALTAPKHYGHPASQVATDVGTLIRYPGFRFSAGELDLYLRAFDLLVTHPRLGFADCVVAARCEAAGHDLATFDRHFDAIPTLTRWAWDNTTP